MFFWFILRPENECFTPKLSMLVLTQFWLQAVSWRFKKLMAWRGLKRKSISVSNRRLNWDQAKCLQLSTTKKVFKERKTFNGSSMAFNDNNPTLHTGDITRWMKLGKKKVISYWSWQPKKEWVKSLPYFQFLCTFLRRKFSGLDVVFIWNQEV